MIMQGWSLRRSDNGIIKLDIVNKSKSDKFLFKKIIDKSTFKYGLTIPKASEDKFLSTITNKYVKRESIKKYH